MSTNYSSQGKSIVCVVRLSNACGKVTTPSLSAHISFKICCKIVDFASNIKWIYHTASSIHIRTIIRLSVYFVLQGLKASWRVSMARCWWETSVFLMVGFFFFFVIIGKLYIWLHTGKKINQTNRDSMPVSTFWYLHPVCTQAQAHLMSWCKSDRMS